MQKKIIALAIAAAFATPVAMAADNISFYGSIDAGVQSRTGAGATAVTMSSSLYNSNRWGFKGSEDLGDGMKATVAMEGGFNTATSAEGNAGQIFDRGTAVGLSSGDHGVVLGGRQYSTSFKVIGTYDPLNYKFLPVTGAQNMGSVAGGRYSNDIAYTGKFGDVTVMANKAMGTAGNDSDAANSVGVTFKSGAINVGAAYTVTKVAAQTDADTHMTVGGGFNFGDGSVKVGYTDNKTGTAAAPHTKNVFAGLNYDMSNKIGLVFGYYNNKADNAAATVTTTTTNMILGGTYSLSKRTVMYAELDKKSVDNTVTTTDTSGFGVGLQHSF